MHPLLPASFAVLLTAAPLAAAELVFTGPEIAKVDWNTRCLQPADINGDGRDDLVLINNDRASVEFLLQRVPGEAAEPAVPGLNPSRWEPVLEDARFKRVTLTIGSTLFDLVTGDFDADGRADLAYTGEPDNLTLRLQRDDHWETRILPLAPAALKYPSGLRVADLDGDGRDDLVLLGQKELATLLQTKPGEFTFADRLPLAEENPFGLEIIDVDGDGRPDLAYLTNSPVNPLRVRRQNADGRYGPEEAFDLRGPRSLLQPLKLKAGDPTAAFVTVLGTTGQLEFSRFAADADDDGPLGGLSFNPLVFAPRLNVRNPALPLFGDFDGDGSGELAFADPDGAQLHVYTRDARGDFTTARAWPSLSDVRSAATVPWGRKGADHIVLASTKEGVFAELSADRDGRFGPPRTLAIPGRPVAVAGGTLRASAKPALVTIAEQDGKRLLTLWSRDKRGLQPGWQTELAGLRTDPREIRLHDLDQDGRTDLLVFVPRDGVRIWLQGEDGAFVEATTLPAYRPGLLARVEPAAVSTNDIDGDGRAELLVVSENFARALRMTADGELVIAAQFNASDSTAELDAAFVLPASKREPARVILRNRKADEFQILDLAKDGAAVPTDTRRTGRIEPLGTAHITGPRGRPELFLFARDRFWWLPIGRTDLRVHTDSSVGSDLPEVRYNYVLGDDLDGDGVTDLVAIDTAENLVEVRRRDTDGDWRAALHFKIFEVDARGENRQGGQQQEPREAVTADVTGDGKLDLILLVHDRILVYPQK